ncbi:L-ascorbate metabolism protein UlaG (beta-lactamase superfamily) [Anoxybacillus tengchongensis]|uniref:L-ascorbate metabolism protein UlaG (Beta-lactamase superfamily) n=1 Tax=Anoxybacillus tengchongensis TaxID=576944 RepID=A0A7X0D9A5_9BACL|nr:MBL fold metallo-hydrolase [Anoxybacillus tengchongensis]MBB6176433.1 L-ascorbate metabolism protein UlaG (beta-lactamase superfamily) [Anoxybacillus tengchongensis]
MRKRYENLDGVSTTKTFADLRRWYAERKQKQKDWSYTLPREHIHRSLLHTNKEQTLLTWVGHATFIIQINGLTIVTDPVWAKRLGTVRRLTDPALSIDDIPPVDIVLISHSHYDHLHFSSIKQLKGNPLILVPSGLRSSFLKRGFERVVECCWWETVVEQNVSFTFVPAQHWSKRTLFDTNTSHWGGWVIETKDKPTFYFAGDSGYFRGFRDIGERFRIDYALLPIGAYEPEWFMGPQHVTPEEAVQAFIDCQAKTFIPMHYGTFPLADDTPKEALERLYAEWERRNLPNEQLRVLKLGEIVHCEHETAT